MVIITSISEVAWLKTLRYNISLALVVLQVKPQEPKIAHFYKMHALTYSIPRKATIKITWNLRLFQMSTTDPPDKKLNFLIH